MRKIISLVLCIAMLISSSNIVLADEITEEAYHTVPVEFSDNIGNAETLQVMIKNDNVYANAEELGTRLGYEVGMSEEYVSIYNRDADENVPYGLTVFYYDSTKAGHMLFTQMADSYEAPFETIKNENGVWIPLEYSLLLLNSSMLVVDNTILIDMPSKNIIDIYMDVLKNNQTYLFDWQDDIGISEKNEDTMGKASFVATMFNGLLNMDGESWVQSIQNFALDSSAYDSKYSEELAMLFCTYSDGELQQEVKAMNKLMSHFDGKGALGKAIKAIDKQLDENIDNLLKTSNHLKSQIDVDNNASIAAYNKSYQALENACDKAKFFSDATELYTKVGKGVAEATSFLDKFYKVAEVVGFADEFQNQDKYAVNALSKFVVNTDSQSVMSNAMKNGIVNYVGTLKTDIATYSALRYLKENYDDLIFEAADLTASFGLTANLMLIGWSVMSANIPFYKEGLSNTDSFMLSMYASIFQADSFTSYQTLRNSIFSDVNNITPENLYKISQYCYTYLKFCYITRDAALGALSEGTKTAVPDLIEYQNNINEEIAGYLVQLKNADKTNESKCYGFLPEDNKEYLNSYNTNKTSAIIGLPAENRFDMTQWLDSFLDFYDAVGGSYSDETGGHENWIIGEGIQYGNYDESTSVDEIYIEGDEYSLYGINVGMDVKEGQVSLKDWEEDTINTDLGKYEYSYEDKHIWFSSKEDNTISEFGFWRDAVQENNNEDNQDEYYYKTSMNGAVVEVENTYPNLPYTTKMTITLDNGSVLQEVYDLGDNYGGWIGSVQTVDLTGDGIEEIILCLDVVGSTYGASQVYVYQLLNGNLYTLLELNDEVISEITDKINTCSNIEVVDSKLIVQGNTTAMGYDNITIVFNSDGTWKIEE